MDNLKILSWNICWECMSANNDKHILAVYCKNTKTCLPNVVDLIEQEKYDIIGLQEAAKYKDIIDKSAKLQKMGCIHHALDNNGFIVDLTTFYNIRKFKVLAVKVGNLFNKLGRPYHIIFLQYNITSDKYIIINLHNGHYVPTKSKVFSKDYLEKTLGANIEELFIVDSSETQKNFMNIEKKKLSNGSHLFKDIFKTIVLGDFNDRTENYWKGLQPFRDTSFPNLSSIVVSSKEKTPPPITCCTNNLRTEGDNDLFIGDYILIDDSLKYSTNNTIVQYFMDNIKKKVTSDHKPVYAIIEIPTPALAVVPVVVPDAVLPAKQEIINKSAQLTKEYICIPNPKGQFSSRLDCESNTVSIKQDPAQLKTEVINEVLNQIIGKLYNGYDFLSDPSLIDTYKHKLQQLYDKKLKLYTRYDYLDFKSFMDILKEDDFFKDKIILVETHPLPYAYKYMKYKIKYLTLKNNTHYNKYL